MSDRQSKLAQLQRLEAAFDVQGGRGVELAEQIDALRAELDADENPRLTLARELCEEHRNEWGGGDDAETIAGAPYAVCVERDDDAWVLAAHSLKDIAGVILGTLVGTEGYDENVTRIVGMETGEEVSVTFATSVVARMGDEVALATEQTAPEPCPYCGLPLEAEVWNCPNIEAHRVAVLGRVAREADELADGEAVDAYVKLRAAVAAFVER